MSTFYPKSIVTIAILSCHGTTSAKARRTWPSNRSSTTLNPSTRTPTSSTFWHLTSATPKLAMKTSSQSFPKTLTFCTCQKDIFTWPQHCGLLMHRRPVFTRSLFWTIRSSPWLMEKSMVISTISFGWMSTMELWELPLRKTESLESLQTTSSVWIDSWQLWEV